MCSSNTFGLSLVISKSFSDKQTVETPKACSEVLASERLSTVLLVNPDGASRSNLNRIPAMFGLKLEVVNAKSKTIVL